jgi:hypothetical protein
MPQTPLLPQQPNFTNHTFQAAANKQSTNPNSNKQKKAMTAMTMMTGYPGTPTAE